MVDGRSRSAVGWYVVCRIVHRITATTKQAIDRSDNVGLCRFGFGGCGFAKFDDRTPYDQCVSRLAERVLVAVRDRQLHDGLETLVRGPISLAFG